MTRPISSGEMEDAKMVSCGLGIYKDDKEIGAYLHGVLDGWDHRFNLDKNHYDTKRSQWCYGAGTKVGALLRTRESISLESQSDSYRPD